MFSTPLRHMTCHMTLHASVTHGITPQVCHTPPHVCVCVTQHDTTDVFASCDVTPLVCCVGRITQSGRKRRRKQGSLQLLLASKPELYVHVCVYNTEWDVFSIKILDFCRGKQVSEDDKEPDEDLKKVGTCPDKFLLHLYTCTALVVPGHICRTSQPFFPSGTIVKFQGCGPDASMTKIKVCCSLLFSCVHFFSGVLFTSFQLCTCDGNLTCLLDFLRSSSRNMLLWLTWSTPLVTPRCACVCVCVPLCT